MRSFVLVGALVAISACGGANNDTGSSNDSAGADTTSRPLENQMTGVKYIECARSRDVHPDPDVRRIYVDGYVSPIEGRLNKSILFHQNVNSEQLVDVTTSSKNSVTEMHFKNPFISYQSDGNFVIVTEDFKTGFWVAETTGFCYPGHTGCSGTQYKDFCMFVR